MTEALGKAAPGTSPLPKAPSPKPEVASGGASATPAPTPSRDRLQTGPLPPKAADPLLAYRSDPEAIVQEALRDGPKGMVGEAVDYWREKRQDDGVMGYVAAGMEGLLELSGLPAVERSAQELGARVGAGADGQVWAATKLTFNCGMVLLNGLVAGKAVTSGAKALGVGAAAANAGKAALPGIVRHYTSAKAVAAIESSGVLFASKTGLAGGNKIYMVGEKTAEGGLNVFRRLNFGHAGRSSTAKAIEIDLSKLPPAMRERFTVEAQKGFLNLEHFITHTGQLKLAELGPAVRIVDAAEVAVTMEQALKGGYALTQVGQLGVDTHHLAQGLAGGGQ